MQRKVSRTFCVLLDENVNSPVDRDEVYNEVLEQTKNFKKINFDRV